jgi:hypothetical protein
VAGKKSKIDWKWLMSLPKFQRDFELKKLAKKEKEEDETKRTSSKLGYEKT